MSLETQNTQLKSSSGNSSQKTYTNSSIESQSSLLSVKVEHSLQTHLKIFHEAYTNLFLHKRLDSDLSGGSISY